MLKGTSCITLPVSLFSVLSAAILLIISGALFQPANHVPTGTVHLSIDLAMNQGLDAIPASLLLLIMAPCQVNQ